MQKAFFDSEKVLAFFTDKSMGNLGLYSGDKVVALNNRQRLMQEFGIEKISWMKQIHSNVVKIATEEGEMMDCDGLITDKKELALMVLTADCVGVLFWDERNQVVAVAHFGREGTFSKIVKKVVTKMENDFGTEPKYLQVSLGPSIQKCCYEFEGDFLDLPKMIKEQLLESGVAENNIEISNICTKCNNNYFSYRRNQKTGRFAGVIMIK